MQWSDMQFDKYEGLGNDFIVVEQERPEMPTPLVRHLCDRHFGVGADGVLIISPSEAAKARMTVLNADGSQPEMCGNGLRCVALHLARPGSQGSSRGAGVGAAAEATGSGSVVRLAVQTDAGLRRCEVAWGSSPDEAQVTLDLGQGEALGTHQHVAGDRSLYLERIGIGNPHAVLFDSTLTAAEIDALAPAICAAIPGGANVEFVEQRSASELHVIVWERGVGRTLACGTGAGAVAVAAALAGRVPYEAPIAVHLPGGALTISVAPTLHVTMKGPARHVFSGRLEAQRLS